MTLHEATTPSEGAAQANERVIDAIRSHHGELAAQLQDRTEALLVAAQRGDCADPRAALHEWYRSTLLPHLVAEEQALYSAASELDATRLLVCAMLSDHRRLVGLVADLALAQEPFEAALLAASAQVLFNVHLAKENDLLLPALDTAGLELGPLLDGMHAILGSPGKSSILGSPGQYSILGEPGESGDGCGCGCGCGCGGAADEQPGPQRVEISSAPLQRPTAVPDAAVPADGAAELDVRALPHGQRHEIIFGRLDALPPGQALVIVNDHDPKPLRYQTEALWPDRFTWTYRQAGPDIWRVAITRVG